MKTINIKGKEYVPVVERVKELYKLYPTADLDIKTEIIGSDEKRVIVKATISITHVINEKGIDDGFNLLVTGHSQAEWGKGMMGNVALEVAETSAIGRALGFANIGLINGIASADEMRKVSKVDKENVDEDLGF